MNIELILSYLPQILSATWLTVQLMLLASIIGLGLALLLTAIYYSNRKFLQWLVNGYIFFIRGTPLLVQIFLIYYGLSQFDWLRESFLWGFFQQAFYSAVFALALNTAAYTTILLRGAIDGIPRGEVEAAKALGFTKLLRFRSIIIPRAFRVAIAPYSNELIIIVKSTSLASTITLLEITGITRQIVSQTYAPLEFYITAGLIYLLLNGIIIALFKWLESVYCQYKLQ